MTACIPSIHVFLGRSLFLLSSGIHSIINFGILSSGILLTWPYHCSLFIYIYIYLYLFIYLFRFSTCFEQPCAHHQESQLYKYNIWYMSICVGDRPLCRSGKNFPTCIPDGHLHRVTYTRCIDTIDTPDDEHKVARNM